MRLYRSLIEDVAAAASRKSLLGDPDKGFGWPAGLAAQMFDYQDWGFAKKNETTATVI